MSGITIVEQHLCRSITLGGLIAIGIFVTLLCIAILVIYKYIYKRADKNTKITIRVCSILLIILYIVFLYFQIDGYNTTHIEYTVIIDDSVRFNEFYEKYEILFVNGNKYRVVEK